MLKLIQTFVQSIPCLLVWCHAYCEILIVMQHIQHNGLSVWSCMPMSNEGSNEIKYRGALYTVLEIVA